MTHTIDSLYDLLERIEARPGLYFGRASVSALYHYLHGLQHGLSLSPSAPAFFPEDWHLFHDWVAYKLSAIESTPGWRNLILRRARSEAAGLSLFFDLARAFRTRFPIVVAVAEHLPYYHQVRLSPDRPLEARRYPELIQLVQYGDEPGFFLFCPSEPFSFNHYWCSLAFIETLQGIKIADWRVLIPERFISRDPARRFRPVRPEPPNPSLQRTRFARR